MGLGIRLARVYDSATTLCKAFITYTSVSMPVPNVLAADVFGTLFCTNI